MTDHTTELPVVLAVDKPFIPTRFDVPEHNHYLSTAIPKGTPGVLYWCNGKPEFHCTYEGRERVLTRIGYRPLLDCLDIDPQPRRKPVSTAYQLRIFED